MTYRELLLQAELKLDYNDITLGEFEQMIAPLNREVDVLDKIRAEIKEKYEKYKYLFDTDFMGTKDLEWVLSVIDKYMKGSE